MYKRFTKSWMKHVDFIVLDLLCLYLAYFMSCIIWNGAWNSHGPDIYNQMIYVLALTSICVNFVFDNHKNILHRGYLKELKFVMIQTAAVSVCISTYLFLTKTGEEFSRMTFLMSMFLYAFFRYTLRNIWKGILGHLGSGLQTQKAVLLVTSSDNMERVVAKVQEKPTGHMKVVGIGLSDIEIVEETIQEIPVVAIGEEQILEYIRNSWVDEILICGTKEHPVSKNLIEKCELMGVTVHQCLQLEMSDANVQAMLST